MMTIVSFLFLFMIGPLPVLMVLWQLLQDSIRRRHH